MILPDGINLRSRVRRTLTGAVQPPAEPVEEPLVEVDPETGVAEALRALTVPEVRQYLDDGVLDPVEVLYHEDTDNGGRGRLGVLQYAEDVYNETL